MTCINNSEHERTLRRLRRLIVNKIGCYEDDARREDDHTFRRRRRRLKNPQREHVPRER